MLAWVFMGCTAVIGPNIRTVKRAVDEQNTIRLLDHLENSQQAYVRERAATGLSALSDYQSRKTAVVPLRSCLNNTREKDFVRSACGLTLSTWRVAGLDQELIAAQKQVGGEARYWLTIALLNVDTPLAQKHLQQLENEDDFFISTMLRQRRQK